MDKEPIGKQERNNNTVYLKARIINLKSYRKIREHQNLFFEMINKIDKLLSTLTSNKRGKNTVIIKNEDSDINRASTNI